MLEEANKGSRHKNTCPDSYPRKLGDMECLDNGQAADICSLQSIGDGYVSVDGEAFFLSNRSGTTGQNGLQSGVIYSDLQDVCSSNQGKLLTDETGDACKSKPDMYDCADQTNLCDTSLNWHKLTEPDLNPSLSKLDLYSQAALVDLDKEMHKLNMEPGYSDKLEFAIKLGYTEEYLLVALRKLGPSAGQNELLSELIKLDSGKHSFEEKRVFSEDDLFSSNEASDLLISSDHLDDGLCGEDGSNLRPIVIDGSNVAMSHGNKEVFSCRGIKLTVDWFRQYGHRAITVFVPQWRKELSRPDAPIKDQDIFTDLEKEKILVFTPARRIGGKRVVCYDDRYILKLAAELGGIVVSNDNYRDLLNENPEYRKVIEERLLMYSFVNDRFMPPDDPLGRHGPTLENFLRIQPTIPETLPPPCPYGSKKCTYGNKCKFYHPERGNLPHKSVTEKLAEQAKQKIQEVRVREACGKAVEGEKKQSSKKNKTKQIVQRTSALNTAEEDSAFGNVARKTDQDEQWRLYEEKLDYFRKQFELAEIANTETDNTAVSNPEAVLAHPGHIDPLPACKVRSTSSPPISRVQTPPQIVEPKEQLISGHLLLAKKLSDVSIDHEFKLNGNGDSEDENSTHLPVTDQSGYFPVAGQTRYSGDQSGHLVVHGGIGQGAADHQPVADKKGQGSNEQSRHLLKQNTGSQHPSWQTWSSVDVFPEQQPVPTIQQHLKLSRQMSVSANQDTRRHPKFHHQMSLDPQLCASTDSSYRTRSLPMHRQRSDIQMYSIAESEKIYSFPLSSTDVPLFYSHTGHSGRNDPYFSNVQNYEQMTSHQHSHRGMVRQNSNSDSQLHMIRVNYVDPCNVGSAYNQANVSYGINMTTTDPGSYSTHLQQRYFRSTSMPQCRQKLASRSARHYNDGQFEWPAEVNNNPYLHSQPEHLYLGNDQIQQQFGNQQVHRQPNYQQGSGCVPASSPCGSDHYVAGPFVGQQPRTPSVLSELPSNSSTSQMRTPMPEEMEIKPTDTRYNLYYHLCNLFPEPKVRAVMNLHPNEANPEELYAYIIGAK